MNCPTPSDSALTRAIGNISDGPGFYLSQKTCTWLIAPENASSIELIFSSFATEKNFDFLTVYQCDTVKCANQVLVRSLSGALGSLVVNISTGIMKLVFTSDQIVVDQGFSAYYVSLCNRGYYRSFEGEMCVECVSSCPEGKILQGKCLPGAGYADPVHCNCPDGQYSSSVLSPCLPCLLDCNPGMLLSDFKNHQCTAGSTSNKLVCSSLVDTLDVDGALTIMDAVALLKTGDTLKLNPGYYTGKHSCGIVISTSNVRIVSSGGPANVVIDCAFEDRHFIINADNVTISGLHLTRGSSSGSNCSVSIAGNPVCLDGGSILVNTNSSLSIEKCLFTSCAAVRRGGAISVMATSAEVRLYQVIIRSCSASVGGAVWSNAKLYISHSSVESNTAQFEGGAFFAEAFSSISILGNVSVFNNYAGRNGSAAYLLQNVVFNASCGVNISKNYAADAGAIFAKERAVILLANDVLINDNQALRYGGAIYLMLFSTLNISGKVTFENNNAVNFNGGAIFALTYVQIALSNDVRFLGNIAGGWGGGVHLESYSILRAVGAIQFERNSASFFNGGAIYAVIYSQIFLSEGISFSGNNAKMYGGAIAIESDSLANVTSNVIFRNNFAGSSGGAVYGSSRVVIMLLQNVVVVNNAAVAAGGGIFIGAGMNLRVFKDISLQSNTARYGGAIYAADGVLTLEERVTVTGNIAQIHGGAVYITNSVLNVSGTVIMQFNAVSGFGGAIFAESSSKILVEWNSSFISNKASSGGAIALRTGTSALIKGSTLLAFNNASGESLLCLALQCGGGAVSVHENSTLNVARGCILSNNSAFGDGGAILAADLSTVEVCALFEGNFAEGHGGGLASTGNSYVMLCNGAVLHKNIARFHGGGLYVGGLGGTFEGNIRIEGCKTNGDGGGLFAFAPIMFKSNQSLSSSTVISNTARGSGGGIMIESTNLELAYNHRLSFIGNTAEQDGGGLMIADGGQVFVVDEACPSSMCNAASRGDGVCDLTCMTRECNWDDGDCGNNFLLAGEDALRPCDRLACTTFQSDYDANSVQCTSRCFNASCDWSRTLCASQRAVLATCPLFDAVALASVRNQQQKGQLLYASGGSARGFGRCNSDGCQSALPFNAGAVTVTDGPWPGQSHAARMRVAQSPGWILIQAAPKFQNLSAFTVEVWFYPELPLKSSRSFIFSSEHLSIFLQPDGLSCFTLVVEAWDSACASFPQYSSCRCGPRLLTEQLGTIAAGDESVTIGVDICTWVIAPTGASNISLRFSQFNLNPTVSRGEKLYIDSCPDASCSVATAIPGSPFTGTTFPVMGIIRSGFIRVRYLTKYAVFTGPSFVLHFAASLAAGATAQSCIGAQSGAWNHVSFSMERISSLSVRVSLLLNGASVASRVASLPYSPARLAVAGEAGIAVGRVDLARPPYGYYIGRVSELRVWDRTKLHQETPAKDVYTACRDLQGSAAEGLVACFSFENDTMYLSETVFADTGAQPASNGFVKVAEKALPWCGTISDGGRLRNGREIDIGESWGFCTSKPRLPELGFKYASLEYEPTETMLLGLASMSAADLLDNQPACGILSLHFKDNRAGRYGGGLMHSGCDDSSDRHGYCFFTGRKAESSAHIVFFEGNSAAAAGGGIFIGCGHLPLSCWQQLKSRLGLPIIQGPGPGFGLVSQFASNIALQYGNDIGTGPATLSFFKSEAQQYSYIPGQESLNFTITMHDALGALVVGSKDIIRVNICALSNLHCDDLSSLVLVGFYPFEPKSFLSWIGKKQTVMCSLAQERVIVLLSLVASPEVLPLTAEIECLPCGPGQARKEDLQRGIWYCLTCEPGEYVIEPNNPAFGCQQCPQGALCERGALHGRTPGSLWLPEPETGLYLLIKCPEGHQLLAPSDVRMDPTAQQCVPCGPNRYVLNSSNSLYSCQACPVGAVCNDTFQSRISGAVWTPDYAMGIWLLKTCPAGYELQNTAGSSAVFSQANQECSICPAAFYCVGGVAHRSACPPYSFAVPGAKSLSECKPAAFLEVAVLLPMRETDFTIEKQELLAQALAAACATNATAVRVLRVGSSRRTSGNSILVVSEIAAEDREAASKMGQKIDTVTLNEQLAEVGLPQGAISYFKVVSSSDTSYQFPLAAVIGSVFAVLAGLCLAALTVTALRRKVPESQDERVLRKKVAELRVLFKITPADGFYLSTEVLPLGARREQVSFLHKSWLEAGARLGLLQDFEVRHFDSLCTSLEGYSVQNQALCTWLLDIATFLIRPDVSTEQTSRESEDELDYLTLRERFSYFLSNMSRCSIWMSDRGALFSRLKAVAQELMDEVATLCDVRTEELRHEPGGEALFSLETFKPDLDFLRPNTSMTGRPCPIRRKLESATRQDHPEIRAVVVYEEAVAEAKMEERRQFKSSSGEKESTSESSPTSRNHPTPSVLSFEPQEGVFLWQLHRRALLLNDGFQKQVLSAVKQHESAGSGSVHSSVVSEKFQRTASADTVPSTRSSVKWFHGNGSPSPGLTSLLVFRDTASIKSQGGGKHQILSADEEMMKTFLTNADARSNYAARDDDACSVEVLCEFQEGSLTDTVEVFSAPVKTLSRMQEKLKEYSAEGAQWPLSAYILDPVRACVVCSGPAQILSILRWFSGGGGEGRRGGDGLVVCKVKNKFALPAEELKGGYRDVMVCLVYTDPESGLRIIGEIQVQDKVLHDLKSKMHKLYRIQRASSAQQI